MSKSRVYTQDDGSKVSFEFGADQKLIGITKDGSPVNPNSNEFTDLQDSDDALNAYRVNKHGGQTSAYEDSIEVENTSVLSTQFQKESKFTTIVLSAEIRKFLIRLDCILFETHIILLANL